MVNRQVLAATAFSLILAGAASAEPASTTTPASGASTAAGTEASADMGLAEIVVTAQRREESSQRAAIAISTITGDDIANANVSRPGGLTDLVPALQATDDTGPYSIFYVRGVGNYSANALSDPALLFNFDGVTVRAPRDSSTIWSE